MQETPHKYGLFFYFIFIRAIHFWKLRFIEEAKEYCKECWAVNLCTLCYVNCYDANGLHLSYRHNSCRNERKYLEDNLRRYHALMEANPSELEQYNEMEIH